MPKVSICLPTYNRSSELRKAISSMVAQTYADWEMIVGDDASTDDTPDVVGEFDDPRIRYHRHPSNVGIYGNWNKLIKMTSGEYVSIYHDHDTYLPTIVEESCRVLDEHPDVCFVHTASLLIDREGIPIDVFVRDYDDVTPGRRFQETMAVTIGNPLIAASVMVRREAYEAVGSYDPDYGEGADKDMWMRLADHGSVGYVRVPQAFFLARGKGDATSRFDMKNPAGCRRIGEEWIARLFPEGSAERREASAKLDREWNHLMLRLVLRALALEDGVAAAERANALAPHSRPGTRALIRAVASVPPIRWMARAVSLRAHEASLDRRRLAAEAYCRANPHIARYLPGHTPTGNAACQADGGRCQDGR